MKMLSYSSNIQLPIEIINLDEWIINLSDKEYQGFSKGHRAMGLFKDGNSQGMVNVESIGGHLLIQHYTIITRDRDKVLMRSEKSDAYLFHLIHCHIWVEWKMRVVYKDEHSCTFTCEVITDYPNKVLAIAAKLSAVNYYLQRHVNEEGKSFARSIYRKFMEKE